MRASDSQVRRDSRLFVELCCALLRRGNSVRFRVHGQSMRPNILDGDDVLVVPAAAAELRRGDVVLARNADGLRVHRLSSLDSASGNLLLRSDTGLENDPPPTQVFGKVRFLSRLPQEQPFTALQTGFVHPLRTFSRRFCAAAVSRLRQFAFLLSGLLVLACSCASFFAPAAHAQTETADLQLTQTASASAVAAGSDITYTDVVKNNTSSATVTTGTITVYMQTPPNTTYQSSVGTNWTCTNPGANGIGPIVCTYNTTLASGSTASNLTITFLVAVWRANTAYAVGTRIVDSNGNIEQVVTAGTSGAAHPTWSTTLGGQTTDNSVTWQNAGTAAGTTIQSSATVTNSTFVDTVPSNNTSLTSFVIEPTTTSDLAVSMSVSPTPVFVSSTLTYTIAIQNLGQASAPVSTGVLSDTLPTNAGYVSYTASAGWSCPTVPTVGSSGTVSCSITSAMAMGIAATITITVTAPSAAQTLTNTATASLTGDPNSSNNSATTYTVVQPIACATPGKDGAGGTLTGIVNAYYPPAATGTLASSSTSVTLGAAAGAPAAQTPISNGDLLLIIQMQGATIDNANTSSYGHGVPGDPGAGSTNLGNSGLFEFVTATNAVGSPVPVTGGTLQFTGTGPTGGLLNTYTYAPATASTSLGTATAASWANNIATFTFSIPLPSGIVPDSVLTTTGFAPVGYNLTEAPILSVNPTTGVITVALTTSPGSETALGTGSFATQGQQNYQVIRVPQYTSAILSSGLVPLGWNATLTSGKTATNLGGVLAIDVSSQLTLGGTVALDSLGFRGGGGITLTGTTNTVYDTDYVTASPVNLPNLSGGGDAPANSGTNASKGEGVAGTPHWVAPPLGTVTNPLAVTSVAASTGQSVVEGFIGGSFARGGPGNAGGGGTDGDPANNDYNSGGGAGGNGGTGGQGGYGWNSMAATNTTDGGFGGVAFPASTSALVMGGGGGAGTTNNGTYYIPGGANNHDCGTSCTGIFSSGGAGGGIAIIHAGSVTGAGTITSNGESTLDTLNDSTGGGGAGGSILVYANSGGLNGLTVNAVGGNGGSAWVIEAPGGFPGQRHGPGGGGGGGVIFLTSTPASSSVVGGANGYTDTVQDSYGSTPGSAGVVASNLVITETPGTQSGAYCGSADLAVTNSASPTVVLPGGDITYTQTVTNNGPLDAVNAVFSESVPANTTFVSINTVANWTCTTPAAGGTGTITCTNPDFTVSGGSGTFVVVVQVAAATPSGTQITDVDNITSGTTDPNLANNTSTAVTIVGATGQADLAVAMTASAPTVIAGDNVTMTAVVTNNGPSAASTAVFSETIPANTTLGALFVPPSGWSCNTLPVGTGNGSNPNTLTCTDSSVASQASSTFAVVLTVISGTASGTIISDTANVSSATPDPNYGNNSATATTEVASTGQADLAVTNSGTPNPVAAGNSITYTQTLTNLGPTAITASATAPIVSVTFTDTIPANTVLASAFNAPTGWSCNTIAVGGSGTFTCTLNSGSTLGIGTANAVSFPLVVKVNAGTASGTIITNTASVSSSVSDPNLANNTATVNTTVASPTQAYLTITKTASPEPVDAGSNLAYTITVQNAGPAVAQNVAVSDVIQSQVAYSSSSSTAGTCTYTASSTTVDCSLGSLSVGSIATITINVTAEIFSSSGVNCPSGSGGSIVQVGSCNTATVSTSTSNANPTTSSSVGSTIQTASAVDLSSFRAYQQADGTVRLVWHTAEESRNLGFHIYRDDASGRHRIDRSLIAGSALLMRGSKPQHAAKTYAAIDAYPAANATYWIEDVDINGSSTLHGPAYVEFDSEGQQTSPAQSKAIGPLQVSPSLAQLHSGAMLTPVPVRPVIGPNPVPPRPTSGTRPFDVADHDAVQISVTQEGWYHIPFAQLFSAGLSPSVYLQSLHLYAEGIEQPLLLMGHTTGIAYPSDAIEFYGTPIDTPFSGTRIYWLISEPTPGNRIVCVSGASFGASGTASFPFGTVLEERTVYFAALLNGENNDNFFGAVVTTDPVDQTLTVRHRDTSSTLPLTMDVALQSVVDAQPHAVTVQFNGSTVGTLNFYGQLLATQSFSIDPSLVLDGANTVTLTALDGDNDVSAVQSIQLHYLHTYAADSDWLEATALPGTQVQFTGFANSQVRVFDITNPLSISEIAGTVAQESGAYNITVVLPGNSSEPRTLLAFSNDMLSAPAALAQYVPSLGDQNSTGADIVVITYPDFASHLAPLVQLRESQGYRVAVVTTDQIYDQYNYGEHSPFALLSFLQQAATTWQRKPQAVLLVGRASMDPRNYLGFGYLDLVPTRIIETAALKTASDDWLTDFQQTGFATIPTGRLPAQTTSDVDLMVSKILSYEQGVGAGSWNGQALLIADQNIDANFTAATTAAAATLPSSLNSTQLLTDGIDPSTAHSEIVAALNSGALLVDYNGHGAEQQWSFSDIFDNNDAAELTNGSHLPVYLLMDCLNGLLQDVYGQTLAEAILLAPNGGGVAVWASSGLTNQPPQAAMNLALLHQFAAHPGYPLGRLILNAKTGTTDSDVRRTWNLFGDPSMKFHFTPSSTGSISGSAPGSTVPTEFPHACPRGTTCTRENQ